LTIVAVQRPKKDARLTLRITDESKKALRIAADRKDRTLNWLAQDIFDRFLAGEKKRRKR